MIKGYNNFIEFCKNCEESERGLDGERERERIREGVYREKEIWELLWVKYLMVEFNII